MGRDLKCAKCDKSIIDGRTGIDFGEENEAFCNKCFAEEMGWGAPCTEEEMNSSALSLPVFPDCGMLNKDGRCAAPEDVEIFRDALKRTVASPRMRADVGFFVRQSLCARALYYRAALAQLMTIPEEMVDARQSPSQEDYIAQVKGWLKETRDKLRVIHQNNSRERTPC